VETIHILEDAPKKMNDIARVIGSPQRTILRHPVVLRNTQIVSALCLGHDMIYSIITLIVDKYNLRRAAIGASHLSAKLCNQLLTKK
jgi:hypothetical protein